MSRKTNAIRLIEAAGVAHEVRSYDLAMEDFSAEAVAELIDMPAAQVFKTLLVAGDAHGPCFAVVPGDAELDLKALARAAGERRMDLVPMMELERLTGYRRGGVTALGAKKRLPVLIDESALSFDQIVISAGVKGLQVVLAPDDYVALTEARLAPLQRD